MESGNDIKIMIVILLCANRIKVGNPITCTWDKIVHCLNEANDRQGNACIVTGIFQA